MKKKPKNKVTLKLGAVTDTNKVPKVNKKFLGIQWTQKNDLQHFHCIIHSQGVSHALIKGKIDDAYAHDRINCQCILNIFCG